MYLSKATLRQIKGIALAALSFRPGEEPGWHVILGDNGSGKSTLIRAIALALVGPDEAAALREDWSQWIAWGQESAGISLALGVHATDHAAGQGGGPPKSLTVNMNLNVVSTSTPSPTWGGLRVELDAPNRSSLKRYLWGPAQGWFSSSFGPFRRFSGGNRDYERLIYANPLVARHLSAFSEEVALGESLEWLKKRKREEADTPTAPSLTPDILRFVNDSQMLPHDVRMREISSSEILFEDGNGATVEVQALSDGYRSILALTFELLRQLSLTFGEANLFAEQDGRLVVPAQGVVLIDEIDVHLHPTWQASIGAWFKSRFPGLQFIVATHSPLVCRAVGPKDRIFRLSAPGLIPEGAGALVELDELERDKLRFGSIHKALESEGFGLHLSRPPAATALLLQLSALNRRARKGELSPSEQAERRRLMDILSDDPGAQGDASPDTP